MPPKASSTSFRGGRSSRKGFKLALPESSSNNISPSKTRSLTQSGSSTQKCKQQDGSFTLLNQTSKQAKADYAFPIKTLLALQEIGLTKIPKKTWDDIASELDDESEIDLKTLIQKAKDIEIICNSPKEKQIITPMATPAPKPTNSYICKNNFSSVLQMESEYWEKNPFKAIAKVFPPGFHFKPTTINKTRTFYEFILIDSDSVSIKHLKDPKEPLLKIHSTIQILKVLQPRQFGSNLNEIKKISIPF
ncbi:hypothetical protein GmHk_15G044496 [Glycine max]|nr:hypothetical protein GmHk_15G044496 [Glycine max]